MVYTPGEIATQLTVLWAGFMILLSPPEREGYQKEAWHVRKAALYALVTVGIVNAVRYLGVL